MISILALAALFALLLYACYTDLTSLRIPNLVPGTIVILFIPFAVMTEMPLPEILMHLLAGAAVLAVTFLAYAAGLKFGGGDAKLLSALSLWCGFSQMLPLFLFVSLAGAGIALMIPLCRQFGIGFWLAAHGLTIPALMREAGEPCIPYGLAIAGGYAVLSIQ